jgi:hypothetical protein
MQQVPRRAQRHGNNQEFKHPCKFQPWRRQTTQGLQNRVSPSERNPEREIGNIEAGGCQPKTKAEPGVLPRTRLSGGIR